MRRPCHAYLMRVRLSEIGKELALGVSLLAILGSGLLTTQPAYAQSVESGLLGKVKTDPNAQMLLQADQLIYDNDAEKVSAQGSVQIDYNGYKLVARKVSYNQKTKRIVASGNVEIVEPNGHVIVADTIDITDDFGNGFLNALRVETPEDTRFAAESAERFDGQKTVFNQGIYTACKVCKENPEKPPLWQIKARTVVLDGKAKTVTYRDARFELFGLPIAYLPYFSHADPSTKRKSGFLVPQYSFDEKLGYSIRVPYFWATGENHDLTVAETWYSTQGFLTDLEWRHQLDSGFYTFQAAGINQQKPSEFTTLPDSDEEARGMITTTGKFEINPRWSFGWNAMIQSDRTFSRSYNIAGYQSQFVTNEVFLRGLSGRNYFDLSAYQYLVQDTPTAFQQQDEQALVHPVLDYNYVKSEPVYGGQLSYNVNLTSISRTDPSTITPTSGDTRFHGIDGTSTRGSINLEWKRRITTTNGMSFTPSLAFEGNAFLIRPDGSSAAPAKSDEVIQAVPSFGLEYRWPFLATVNGSSHIFEPIAQIFVRPDVNSIGGLPNEDAQSLVFDTTTLFRRNKFSGYDRLEGGTRANVGLRYSGLLNNGMTLSALVGQSFHLAGKNPYARENDVVNTGEESGLESDESDIVAMAGVNIGNGYSVEARGRFDPSDFLPARLEASGRYRSDWLSLSAGYALIGAQPDYGFSDDREQASASGSLKIAEYWRVFGAAVFDIENNQLISDSFGVSYLDECFSLSLAFSETRNRYTSDVSGKRILLRIGIRTIGTIDHSQSLDEFTTF
jgi:LPS-assembly protein